MKTNHTQPEATAPMKNAPVEKAPGLIREFWQDEQGAMILEYVLLLTGSLLLMSFMIHPVPSSTDKLPALQNALMSFSRDVFEALTQP